LFSLFEKLIHPFPTAEPRLPPQGFVAFLWGCTEGLRGKIAAMAMLAIVMSAFDALLYAILGRIVDWLGTQVPSRLWTERGGMLLWVAALLGISVAVQCLETVVKH